MSTWTVASSGCVLLLLEAWHFSWECRSWRPRFLTAISLRTRWPPTLVLRTVETLLATCSFRYHVTTGWGFPMTKETKKLMHFLWFSQRSYWAFRPSLVWRCVDDEGGTLPTDTTPYPRNLNTIIASFSAFFAHNFGDCCIMYPSPAENVSTAPLCFERLTLQLLMSYIYGTPILDVSRSHTTTQHSR
jgi:hypothetical protein